MNVKESNVTRQILGKLQNLKSKYCDVLYLNLSLINNNNELVATLKQDAPTKF